MYIKKYLGFSSLIKYFSKIVSKQNDNRAISKSTYTVHDTILSGLACMYIQCPSLLSFQRAMEEKRLKNNLQTQFNIKETPKDSQMRIILDEVPRETFKPLFKEYLTRLQRNKWLSSFNFHDDHYLLLLDATQYYNSNAIHCQHCLTQTKKGGEINYSHKVVQAVIAHPQHKQIIPMLPEEIRNTDGESKQDCEINAAKRLMPIIQKMHPRLKFIRTGDSLYATTPFIKETLEQGDHFLFAVKPGDHKTLFKNLKEQAFERYDEIDKKGKKFIYEFCENIPMTKGDDSLRVNVMKLRIATPNSDGTHKVTYTGTWITDMPVDKKNVSKLVKGARCRWRIENACFNVMKNYGYDIEHNYGHGDNNLCFNFYMFTLLSFYLHQILELCDKLFKAVRMKCGTLKETWMKIRILFNMHLYDSWEDMLDHILNPDNYSLQRAGP